MITTYPAGSSDLRVNARWLPSGATLRAMANILRKLLGALAAATVMAVVLAPPPAASAATGRTYFRYCNKGHLGFGMTFQVISARGGHVAEGIRYYISGIRPARDNTIVVIQKGPALFHREKGQIIYALTGESDYGTITNASSDGRWHTFNQTTLSLHPLPLGTFPDPGSSYWKLFMHYVVVIRPHGQITAGCSFNLQIDGPTNAYFP